MKCLYSFLEAGVHQSLLKAIMTQVNTPSSTPSIPLGQLKYMDGRRVNRMPENPGEYYGPVTGYAGDKPVVFYYKPNAEDADAPKAARRMHYVVSPPHVFTEEPDGTLTIRASLGDTAGPGSKSDGWHGYLTKGVWEKL
jgi:hypothetical protein